MSTLQTRHPEAYRIGAAMNASDVNWIRDKKSLIGIVDSVTDDVLAGYDIKDIAGDDFLLKVLGDYVAGVLLSMDEHFGWDVPGQPDSFEDALLGFLGRRWLFYRATGRLR